MEEIRLDQVKNNEVRWDYYWSNWEQIYFNDDYKLQIDRLKHTPFVRVVLWSWNSYANDWFKKELTIHKMTLSGRIEFLEYKPADVIDYLKGLSLHLRGKGL